jgi:hypothetical protein
VSGVTSFNFLRLMHLLTFQQDMLLLFVLVAFALAGARPAARRPVGTGGTVQRAQTPRIPYNARFSYCCVFFLSFFFPFFFFCSVLVCVRLFV